MQYRGTRVSRDKLGQESEEGSEEEEDEEGSEDDDEEEEEDSEEGSDDGEEGGVEVWGEDEDIDSEDAMGSGDEERFKGYKFKGSRTTEDGVVPQTGDKVVDTDSEEEEQDDEEDDESSNPDQDGDSDAASDSGSDSDASNSSDAARQKALSSLLAADSTTVARNLSSAAASEASKGAAIIHQQKAFDALLSARIKFQPALQSTNTLPSTLPADAADAAYTEALALFNTLSTLRHSTLKRKLPSPPPAHTDDDSLEDIYSTLSTISAAAAPTTTQILEKWSQKTTPVSAAADTLSRATTRGLTASINDTLASDRPRHVARTQIPRACAPGNEAEADVAIFDDTDFYGQLLRALVDARSADGGVQAALEVRDTKRRKKVDTKASKGRKMRYQVHEKLVGFVAPVEGWERWRDEQRRELFAGLLGQRVEKEDGSDDEEMQDVEEEEEVLDTGLRLFA